MDNQEIQKPSRPLFLTILCVLSFFGSIYTMSSAINNAGYPEIVEEMKASVLASLDEFKNMGANDDATRDRIEGWEENIDQQLTNSRFKKLNTFWGVGSFITLLGAMLMWRLRKIGFHLYVGGNLVLIVSVFMIFGSGFTAWILSASHLFFGVLFTALYALNFKVLR